jgi:hypothetical protein
MATSIVIYLLANAVFPHYPESFSNPWFDVTIRFGLAEYLPYNLGWLLGLTGLWSVLPYLVVIAALIAALLLGGWGGGRAWQRVVTALGGVAVVAVILGGYHLQLSNRRLPVPVRFIPWIESIWEPRHPRLQLRRLLPAGDPRTGGLETVEPWRWPRNSLE